MKDLFINSSSGIIKKSNPTIDEEDLEVILYGLEIIYIAITKVTVILLIALLFKVVKETLFVLIFFNIVRSVGFGMHAQKSWHCYIISTTLFVGGAILSKVIDINIYLTAFISIFMFYLIVRYAPADTVKRPIISKKRRKTYKLLTSIFSLILIIISIIFNNYEVSDLITIGLSGAAIMLHPLTYKIFGLPYNNYKTYNDGLI